MNATRLVLDATTNQHETKRASQRADENAQPQNNVFGRESNEKEVQEGLLRVFWGGFSEVGGYGIFRSFEEILYA